MRRTRAYRRHQTQRHIDKRLYILKHCLHPSVTNPGGEVSTYEDNYYYRNRHALNKANFTCSCNQCRNWKLKYRKERCRHNNLTRREISKTIDISA